MSPSRARMLEDKRLRDAARSVVKDDIDNLKTDLSARSASGRIADRIAAGASDIYDEAIDVARDHKGALAAIAGALVLWFARNPLLATLFGDDWAEDDDDADYDEAHYAFGHRASEQSHR